MKKITCFIIIIASFVSGVFVNDAIKSFYGNKAPRGLINVNIEEKSEIENKADFKIFWDSWKIVEDKYKIAELDYKKMMYGAISGMLYSLGDPYTVFLDPEENRIFKQDIKGSFGGIGAEIGFKDKFLTVIAPLKESPAEKAGILPGDKILKVDDKEIIGLGIDEAVDIIRGEKGTKVKLTISRDGFDELKEIEIIRDTIVIKTVEWEMKENGIYYIKISQFNEKTVSELDNAINEILANNVNGVILDLRNNPGGILEVSIDVASRFIDKGKLVVTEDYIYKKVEHKTYNGNRFKNIPIVVLINEGSASASEILAGALRDNNGTKLVGKKTFGKGSVQEMEKLSDGSSIKITVAKWLTPNGKNIDKEGISPDFEVDIEKSEDNKNKDLQLEKALEILRGEIQK